MALSQEFVFVDSTQHNLKDFDCGKPVMNQYLARHVVKNMRVGISRTWVLPIEGEYKQTIAAYYTLASSTIKKTDIPVTEELPGYPVPVVILARLAVDIKFNRRGLGEKTLITSLRKSVQLTNVGLPALGIVLDVLDQDALSFYQKFDMFLPFTDDPMRLFVPMNIARQI